MTQPDSIRDRFIAVTRQYLLATGTQTNEPSCTPPSDRSHFKNT